MLSGNLTERSENIGACTVRVRVDWAKLSRVYIALAFQGLVSFIVSDKALNYHKSC